MNTIPEPDRIEGVKHPNETLKVFGHDAVTSKFLRAFDKGRLHHAWMLTGPKGIGKALVTNEISEDVLRVFLS